MVKPYAKLPTDAFGRPVGMPVLIPIPIPTRGLPWYRAIYNVLFYRREFWLGEDFDYRLPTGQDVVIPAGFVFNGASVPRMFWSILNPIGILLIPGLLHDYAYRYQVLHTKNGVVAVEYKTRREADSMFLEVCLVTNGMVTLNLIVSALQKSFGWIGWNKNRRLENES